MNQNADLTGAAARHAVEDLQHDPFAGAKRALDRARIILAGETAEAPGAAAADQATREPSPDTVQNPADE